MNRMCACLQAGLLSLSFALAPLAYGAAGSIDTTFGSSGTALLPFTGGHVTMPMALQADGKLLVANQSGSSTPLSRYMPDGSLDSAFASGGQVTQGLGMGGVPYDILVQPDGKILVAGVSGNYPNRNFTLARFNSDGSRDTSFDGDGIVVTPVSATRDDISLAAALQRDGKILLAGYSHTDATNYGVALVRYNANGSLDTSFDGGDGTVTLALGSKGSLISSLAVQPDGKIVAVGVNRVPGVSDYIENALVLRFNPDGSLDQGFANAGAYMGATRSASRVAIQPDGKIVYAGDYLMSLTRLNADGSLDTGFSDDGVFTLPGTSPGVQSATSAQLKAMVLQPDGRIVIGGNYSLAKLAIAARVLPDGTLDVSFGNQGVTTLTGGAVISMMAQPDGKLLAAGVQMESSSKLYLQRLLANDADNNGAAEPWDLTPAAFQFSGQTASPGTLQISGMATISGLSDNVKVPVTVSGGEYALRGSTQYTNAIGYVGNVDKANLRYTAGENPQLTIGGMHAANNTALILGQRVSGGVVVANSPPPTAPVPLRLINVVPKPGSKHVPVQAKVMAVFGSKIDSASLNANSFRLVCNGRVVNASVTLRLSRVVAHLEPLSLLPAAARCTATLTTGIRDVQGRRLPQNYEWQFFTQAPRAVKISRGRNG